MAKEKFVGKSHSYHIAILNAFRQWRAIKQDRNLNAANEWAIRNYLHKNTLFTIERTAEQIVELLCENKFISNIPQSSSYNNEIGDPGLNTYSNSEATVTSILAIGLYPNLAVRISKRALRTRSERNVFIHISSTNTTIGKSAKFNDFESLSAILYTYSYKIAGDKMILLCLDLQVF